MDADLIERLLLQGESSHLDYKRSQYRLRGATTDEKAEIVKDILALANAWREVDGVILLGVAESDGPAEVVGITESIDDADLQQLFNGKTNIPISFRYSEHELFGHRVGVVQVPVQERPIYLRKQFGALKALTVYLRRGTSTVEAAPDEIAKMGRAAEAQARRPKLAVGFAHLAKREALGDGLECWGLLLSPALTDEQLPVVSEPYHPLGFVDPYNRPNKSYWSEMREYVSFKEATTELGFAVTNESSAVALGVRVEFRVPAVEGLLLTTRPVLRPEWTHSIAAGLDHLDIRPINRNDYREIELRQIGEFWNLEVTFGKVQPGATVFTDDEFYVGTSALLDIAFTGTMFADNLDPEPVTLHLRSAPTSRPMTLADIQTIELDSDDQ